MPWIQHPDQIDEGHNMLKDDTRDDIIIQESRAPYKERITGIMRALKADRMKAFDKIECVITAAPSMDMGNIESRDEELVDKKYLNRVYYSIRA